MRNDVLEFFLEKGFQPIDSLIQVIHEDILVFERDTEEFYILVCTKDMTKENLTSSLSTIATNQKDIYIVSDDERHLNTFVKENVFRWIFQKFGVVTVGNGNMLHFQTLQKLQTNGLTWTALSF